MNTIHVIFIIKPIYYLKMNEQLESHTMKITNKWWRIERNEEIKWNKNWVAYNWSTNTGYWILDTLHLLFYFNFIIDHINTACAIRRTPYAICLTTHLAQYMMTIIIIIGCLWWLMINIHIIYYWIYIFSLFFFFQNGFFFFNFDDVHRSSLLYFGT